MQPFMRASRAARPTPPWAWAATSEMPATRSPRAGGVCGKALPLKPPPAVAAGGGRAPAPAHAPHLARLCPGPSPPAASPLHRRTPTHDTRRETAPSPAGAATARPAHTSCTRAVRKPVGDDATPTRPHYEPQVGARVNVR